MAYYECINKNNYIHIGDKFNVSLTGSHNITIIATVCYVDKITVCLLGDTSLGEADWYTQCNYNWNYSLNIKGKEYTGICKIPTHQQIYSKCAGYKRNFAYWTSTRYSSSNGWHVGKDSGVHEYAGAGNTYGTVPFIEITL